MIRALTAANDPATGSRGRCVCRFSPTVVRRSVTYLAKEEMDALLAAPDRNTLQCRRDHAVLLLYNTRARADGVAHTRIIDLDL